MAQSADWGHERVPWIGSASGTPVLWVWPLARDRVSAFGTSAVRIKYEAARGVLATAAAADSCNRADAVSARQEEKEVGSNDTARRGVCQWLSPMDSGNAWTPLSLEQIRDVSEVSGNRPIGRTDRSFSSANWGQAPATASHLACDLGQETPCPTKVESALAASGPMGL